MATMTITRTAECGALNHVTLAVTGDVTYTYHGSMEELTAAITEDEKDAFIKVLLRFAKIGRTRAQVRNALTSGYVVTV